MKACIRALRAMTLVGSIAATSAHAGGTQIAGALTLNGMDSALNGSFSPLAYDVASGAISAGRFDVPTALLQFGPDGDQQVIVHFHLQQQNTSAGQVGADGAVTMSTASMIVHVIDANTPTISWNVGSTCDFGPFDLALAGGASSAGLDIGGGGFTIPAVDASACGGHGSALNAGIAGNQSRTQMFVSGDFTPPSRTSDKIFGNGFES